MCGIDIDDSTSPGTGASPLPGSAASTEPGSSPEKPRLKWKSTLGNQLRDRLPKNAETVTRPAALLAAGALFLVQGVGRRRNELREEREFTAALTLELESLSEEKRSLAEQVEDCTRQREHLRTLLDRREEEVSQYRVSCNDLRTQMDELTESIANAQNMLEAQAGEAQATRKELAAVSEQNKELTQIIQGQVESHPFIASTHSYCSADKVAGVLWSPGGGAAEGQGGKLRA